MVVAPRSEVGASTRGNVAARVRGGRTAGLADVKPTRENPRQADPAYGTNGGVKDHRIRLSDDELDIVLRSLRARAAGLRGDGQLKLLRLAARLDNGRPGNPDWVLDRPPYPVKP